MRRVLMGALLGSFAFHAQASTDETVYEFLVGRAESSREELINEEREIAEAMKKIRDSKSKKEGDEPTELELLKEQRTALMQELAFSNYIKGTVRAQTSSHSKWKTRLEESSASFDTKIKETDLTKLDMKSGESKVLESKTFELEKGSPFKVEQQLRVLKKDDGNHELVVGYAMKFEAGTDRKEWPRDLKRNFEKMDDKTMEKFVNDELNPGLDKEVLEIGKLETLKTDDTKRAAALKNLPGEGATQASSKVFGPTSSAAVVKAMQERASEIGGPDKALSELWDVDKEIDRLSDPRSEKEQLVDLQAKLKIAEALRKNPKIADGKDSCELMIAVIGQDAFSKLSRESQMDCESHIKKEAVAKEESKKEEEFVEKDKAQLQENADRSTKQIIDVLTGCLARTNAMAQATPNAQPQLGMVRSLYNALLARGAGCTYLGSVLGEVTQQTAADDAFKQALFANNPALMQNNPMMASRPVQPGEYLGKARESVQRMAPPASKGKNGADELESQKACLAKLDDVVGWGLQMVNPQDPEVQMILKFQEAARSTIAAIDEELAVRRRMGTGGLTALPSNGPTVNQGVSSGGRTPVRIRDTGSTITERGMSGNGTMNRMNSGGRTGGSRIAPPPKF